MARKKHKIQDINKINEAYVKKIEKFKTMNLEELRKYYQSNPKIGGTYKQALFDTVNTKLQEVKEETIDEKINEIKEKEQNNDDLENKTIS